MSTRTITCLAVTTAALLGPVAGASAMPADHVGSSAGGAPAPVQAAPVRVVEDGLGTTVVLVLIGGTLLAGASGFQSGRIVTRRRALTH